MAKFRIIYNLNNERKYKDVVAMSMYEAMNEFNRGNRFAFIVEVINLSF
jgi:hypothetical protein